MTHLELIAAMEAAEVGSRELDEEIATFFDWKVQCKEMIQKYWLAPDGRSFKFVPPFTTKLDPALPGENIVDTSRPQDRWGARQFEGDWVTAATEPLARRLAVLKARVE